MQGEPPKESNTLEEPSPLELLLEWLEALPPQLRDDLAFQVLFMSGEEPGEGGAHAVALREHADELVFGPYQDGGLAAAYASLIDLAFLNRATKEDWKENRNVVERIRDSAAANEEGGIVRELDRTLGRMEFVGRQWRAAASGWQELRAARLSLQEINAWMWQQAFSRDSQHR